MNEISKLPKWAQAEISLLNNRLEHVLRENATFKGEHTSSVIVDPDNALIDKGLLPKYLPDRCTVRYQIDRHDYFEIDMRDDELKVHAMSSNKHMVVVPHVSNGISIKFVKD